MKEKSICFKKWLLSAAMLFIGMGLVMAQEVKISGVVTAKEDGLPMPGVSVFVKGTTNGTITDFDGNYHLTASQGAVVVYSFIGMTTQEITVGTATTINVVMQSDATDLDEVVVTALGIKRETKKLGYAMTEVKGDEISGVNTVNPIQALQGKSTGLSIGASDGGLFGNSKVQLRGVSVLNSNNNQPIFVIDGVILENSISNKSADWDASSNDFGNILKNLNSDDFESVSVLKGAAATALYGSRGINGAIVIKTKDGKGSKGFGVKVSQSIGIDYVYKQPDLQYDFGSGTIAGYVGYGDKTEDNKYYSYSTDQFYYNTAGVPTKKNFPTSLGWGPRFDGRAMEDYDGSMTTFSPVQNHMKDAYDLGVNSNTSVALTGGNDKGTFYLSDSYNYRTGVMPTNSYERNALQFTGSYNLADWLKADASISFTTSKSKNPWNDFGSQFLSGSLTNWYDSDKWNKRSIYQAAHGGLPSNNYGDKYATVPGNSLWFNYNMNELSQKEQVTRPVVKLTADLASWVSVTAEANMNVYNTTTENKTLGTGFANEGGYYSMGSLNDVSKTFKVFANIQKQINEDVNTNLIVGGEFWDQRKEQTLVETDGGLIVPGKFFLQNSKKTLKSEGKVFGTKQINSFYFLFNAGWKDQLFLDVTGRNDWSSALVYTSGSGNFSYFYPSISTSWIFTETFDMPYWVSFGKLRASYAQVGNDTNPYEINQGYSVGKLELAGGNFAYSNARSTTVVDKNIKPEKKNSLEFGLDFRVLNNRLGLDATYYNEKVNNQIGRIPLPEESGAKEMLANIGSLKTEGVELSLKATPIKRGDFEWTSTLNWWKSKTTISNLREETGEFKLLGGAVNYGNYRVGSVAYENGEYGILMSDSKPKVWKSDDPNDPRNGMKVLAWSDGERGAFYKRSGQVEEVGKIMPDFEGSWDNSFNYKNISVSVLLDARFGGHIASYSNRYGTAYGRLKSSLYGRDAQSGGISWTSGYADIKGQTFDDGIIPEGVFDAGQVITAPNGSKVDVGGMTYQEAFEKGYVEPTHASFHNYFSNDWGNGVVNDNWVSEVKYIALRNISIGYNLPKTFASKIKAQSLYVGLNARNLCYLYNSLPNNLNPESFRGTSSSESFLERSFTPYTATYTMSVNISF